MKKFLVIFCSVAFAGTSLRPIAAAPAPAKMKLLGYITARPNEQVISILDDQISITPATRIETRGATGGSWTGL